ncbi:hypothetical protein K438DRAFT_1973061 [Mycena galopus ATCC 62051]|nr:hypothetical protein K438DRAFT_1973061 [Mycena galopus ATCC 62051]
MDPSSSITINVTENLTQLAGHLLSFRKAVTGAISHVLVQALTPKWIHALSERVHLSLLGSVLKETRVTFEALRRRLHMFVSLSRAWVVAANMVEDDDITHKKLTDDEVFSIIFAFLLAGYSQSSFNRVELTH